MKLENCIIRENFFDREVSEKLYSLFADKNIPFVCAKSENAPLVIGNAVRASGTHLLSMTLPVARTLETDENGDFTFTIFVYALGLSELKGAYKRAYEVKINAQKHGLSQNENDVRRVVKVDLTPYEISIAEDESLGLFAPSDTVCPAILKSVNDTSNEALNFIREVCPNLTGLYLKAGGEELAFAHDTVITDFEWERECESEEKYLSKKNRTEYKAMVKALREKYEGKYLSVLGDSISSYCNICNDTSANVTIGENSPFYPTWSHNVCRPSLTYWGKVIEDLGMKTCIVNSWSGSSAYGRDFGKNMLIRCQDLHRDGGTPDDASDDILPDVILVYMSANDMNGGSPLDESFAKIIANGSKREEIDAWFSETVERREREGGAEKGKTFLSYDAVYALSMMDMKKKYPDAEFYCLTLQETNHPNTLKRPERFDNMNKTIRTLAEYFGATVVDLANDEITWQNCHAYAGDMHSLHPTAAGHEIMAENIVRAMYNK
ncbi:MAG: SGNH/GDSL hydrolase family protein [Clostridia bacterium]|nr:SGNH/GDSL hydrolase family protein [Clostridia bacterium]